MVTVHREGRKAEVPVGGSRQALDARVYARPVKNSDLIRHNCPDLKAVSEDSAIS